MYVLTIFQEFRINGKKIVNKNKYLILFYLIYFFLRIILEYHK